MISLGGRKGKSIPAHRASCMLFAGPVPDGMDIDHVVCNNTRCASWAHVKPATRLENLQRSRAYNMAVSMTGVRGDGHSMKDAYVKANGDRQCRTCHLDKVQSRQRANRARINYRRRAHCAVRAGVAEYVHGYVLQVAK
jgi:HNH endonuclease